MVSFPIIAFVVVKLKILNVFVLIQHHRVFLPLIQSTPTPTPSPVPPPPSPTPYDEKENPILQRISPNVELK